MVTPNSTPPWVRAMEVVVVVDDAPVPTMPATEVAAGDIGNYAGTDQAYETVASWTVATGKVGELKEILIITDDYTKTEIRVTVAGVVQEAAWSPTTTMPLIYEDLKLEAGDVVLVEAQSSDGTAIDVDAVILGKEIG